MKALGEAYAIPRDAMPVDYAAFRRYWGSMLAERAAGHRDHPRRRRRGPAARPARVAWPAVERSGWSPSARCPAGLRGELGLEWGPGRERLLAGSQAAIRRLLPAPAGAHSTGSPPLAPGSCAPA